MSRKIRQTAWLTLVFLTAIAFDQWTKLLAVRHLRKQPAYPLWDGIFELAYTENRGAAFGMLQGKHGFFLLVAALVLAGTVYVLIRMPEGKKYRPLRLVAAFLAAGAVGNMTDRFTRGYVVDFLYAKVIDFPIFNVADCYITVSMFVFVLLLLFYYKEADLSFLSFGEKGEGE